MNKNNLLLRFLHGFCPESLYESIEGDLLEQFDADMIAVGESKAKRRLFWNVLRFFRPGILLRHTSLFKFTNVFIFMNLLNSYLKTTFRAMGRHKMISSINIIGLAVCMSVGLLILTMIKTSRSYDRFHPYSERTYRIITQFDNFGWEGWTPSALANELAQYSFVEDQVTLLKPEYNQVVISGKVEVFIRPSFTENSFFKLFGFHLALGDETSALTNPFSAIITEDASKKLFGTANPLGKVIEIKNMGSFTVTGLIAHHDQRTHIDSEVFISSSSLPSLIQSQQFRYEPTSWARNNSVTYVLLKSSFDRTALEKALSAISQKNIVKENDQVRAILFSTFSFNEIPPMMTTTTAGVDVGMTSVDMLAFSSFGFLFILLAVFNYTNLTVARAFSRAKEVGVRKITGALRIQIAAQIFVESVVFSLIALCIAFFIARFIPVSPGLEEIIDFQLDFKLLFYCIIFALFVGLIAGLFPAIILSRINPLQAIGNLLSTKLFKSLKARNALIVIQFTLSLVFLTIVVVLLKQYNFQITADLGFERKDILSIPLHQASYEVIQPEIEKHAAILQTSSSSDDPFGGSKNALIAKVETMDFFDANYLAIDPQFITTWKIPLVAGNNFSTRTNTEQFIIINETAVRKLAFGSAYEAIGKSVLVDSLHLQVIGVVRDFHSANFRWAISPMVLRYKPEEFREINIKYQPGTEAEVERYVMNVWKKFEPDFPLQVSHYNERFEEQQSHARDTNMVSTFCAIAIFVSCLGLFGVVLYSVEARSKEIAIRKILGSSIARLMIVLSKNFFGLLALSICVGFPVGFLISNEILKTFTYKVDLGVGITLTILGITLCIGFATICSQTIRAALGNPVKALKND